MSKYRIKMTCEDYYDYVGTNRFYHSFKDRIESAVPIDLKKVNAYNIKVKVVKAEWGYHRWYRISFSVKMGYLEFQKMREEIQDHIDNYCHGVGNFSWHQIKKGR